MGISAQIAGRDTPGKQPSVNRLNAIKTPVLPALTQASTAPSLSALRASAIEESCLERTTRDGLSWQSIFDSLWSNSKREEIFECKLLSMQGCISERLPKTSAETSGLSASMRITASIVTLGPKSPPIASMEIFIVMVRRPTYYSALVSTTLRPR